VIQPLLVVHLTSEPDVVGGRQRARQIARLLGFEALDQTRIATAVSEIARNAVSYGGGGRVEFGIEGRTAPQVFVIRVSDRGPGIHDLEDVLAGRYRSSTGMGLGIIGARRLVDQFHVESGAMGTLVVLRKILPGTAALLTAERLAILTDELTRIVPDSPLQELRHQNQELLRTLDELNTRRVELERVNNELEDTNRGVVALYAELDERADHLRRADELKSRFLANMSHEFRTPLNAIHALTHILLERMDGDINTEQERQIGYIRKAAEELNELVNDLLDLAKIEAGKIVIRAAEFEVAGLFGALRGMLRPLLVSDAVTLVFEDARELPVMTTDEAKVSQILRNLISNALKFTERGEVRISARVTDDGEAVVFTVADTGVGIAPEDQERIFQEFGQVENPVQRKVRGTGLGLPLSRRLAELLGGSLTLHSDPGQGSTFFATVPIHYAGAERETSAVSPTAAPASPDEPILVIEDSPEDLLVYEQFLEGSGFRPVPVPTIYQARQALRQLRPRAIILDILLRGQDAWTLLSELKGDEATRSIPLLVITTVDDERKGLGLGADAYCVKPVQRRWLVDRLRELTGREPIRRVLVIDDDEVSRYLIRSLIDDFPCRVSEAVNGTDGLRQARKDRPDLVFLDLVMPDCSGHEVLAALRADPHTAEIPVIVVTSKPLTDDERAALERGALAVINKGSSRDAAIAVIKSAFARAGLPGGADAP
jgi:signal transduction histidine kinase/CheY-like chemotaxis protein